MAGNLVARVTALAALGAATWVVARVGGPAQVGDYALLRMLTSLVGILLSAGLPAAVSYFLRGPRSSDPRLRATILAIALAAGISGALLWYAAVPILGRVLFRDLAPGILAFASLQVITRILVATSKGCAQGTLDFRGSNFIIVMEELMFLPAFGLLWAVGLRGSEAMVGGLFLGDVVTASSSWSWLIRKGFLSPLQRPSAALAREIYAFGMRGQVGAMMSLLNLRLDFAVLGALAGPVPLGSYAIASKYAELLRLPPLAISWVLYPRYAMDDPFKAGRKARSLLPRAGLMIALASLPLGLGAGYLLPLVYGEAFRAAVVPAQILIVGLSVQGVAGVLTAYFYGTGRPGLNSVAMGGGLLLTLALDLLLIPRFGATGAAVASTCAYLTSAVALLVAFWMVTRKSASRAPLSRAVLEAPTR
jgi:O-antigen/teichoic acid export membrane protein